MGIFGSFWRALALTLHPRVLGWSLLPLALMGGALLLLGWFGWEPAVDAVRSALERFDLVNAALQWLDGAGLNSLRAMLAPLLVLLLVVPVVVVVTLALVGVVMTPALVDLVSERYFSHLTRKQGASGWQSLGWSLSCTVAALLALLVSLPLWFIPPLALLLPPLIWGWLTCRVFGFDVLAVHASADERRHLLHVRRWPLLAMGVVCGIAGAAPAMLWALGALTLVLAPLLIVISVWLYTLVFGFAALWFALYALSELEALRSGPALIRWQGQTGPGGQPGRARG